MLTHCPRQIEDLPTARGSRRRHTSPGGSSASTPPQALSEKNSDQDLIAKSKEAEERRDFDEAKSLLLQISNKTIFEPLLEELDMTREIQLQTNNEFARQAKKAELKGDWETAKSLLSRIVSDDVCFLLLALEYSRTRLEWESIEAYELIEQLKKEYPDPRLRQVELEQEVAESKMIGKDDRLDHYRGLFRANKNKIGTLWHEPDDFRKVFQMMAADMQHARDKAWYAHPPRAKKTVLQSQSQARARPQSDSHSYSVPGLRPEVGAQSQSQSQPLQPVVTEELRLLQRARTRAQPQPQSQRWDMIRELYLIKKARTELSNAQAKAKALLRLGSSPECKQVLAVLEREERVTFDSFEEAQTAVEIQVDDASDQRTP